MLCFFTTLVIGHLPRGSIHKGVAWIECRWRSGIGAAIDGETRARDVGRFWPGDERHQRGDFIHMPVAFERREGDLWRCPIACGGVQIGIDGARLNIIDRNAPAPDLAG